MPYPSPLLVAVEESDATLHVRLAGEFDLAGVPLVEKALNRLSRAPVLKRVVFDLRAVSFLDLAGLRTVLRADARGRAEAFEVVVVRPRGTASRIFTLTRVGEQLNVVHEPGQRDNHDRRQGRPPAPTHQPAPVPALLRQVSVRAGLPGLRLHRPRFKGPRQTRLTNGGTPTESGRRMPSVMAHLASGDDGHAPSHHARPRPAAAFSLKEGRLSRWWGSAVFARVGVERLAYFSFGVGRADCLWELARLLDSMRGRQAARRQLELAETSVPGLAREWAGLKGCWRLRMCQRAIRSLRAAADLAGFLPARWAMSL